MKIQTLSVLVQNQSGVLARVAGLFARRGFNIESLAVGITDRPELSRITIGVDAESPEVIEQIVKQLNKLIEVIKVTELSEDSVARELVLIKVHATHETRSEVIDIVNLFRAKCVDVQKDSITIEGTGAPDKLEALIEMLKPYGIRELVQSGLVALGRG